tara:strand:+ start:40 stop:555 length:516 start_codon:yes stop_codon:yes gene_type:complete
MKTKLSTRDKLIIALKSAPKENALDFIRANLAFNSNVYDSMRGISDREKKDHHYRFDMSYNSPINNKILHIFEPLGIYNTGGPFVLSFWKGRPALAFFTNAAWDYESQPDLSFTKCLSGCGTVEIIYIIFQNTIFKHETNRFIESWDISPDAYRGLEYLPLFQIDEMAKQN